MHDSVSCSNNNTNNNNNNNNDIITRLKQIIGRWKKLETQKEIKNTNINNSLLKTPCHFVICGKCAIYFIVI